MAEASYHLTSYGCQMNDHDSQRMQGMLESLGYRQTDDQDRADLILLNTCSIRASADRRLETQLGNAKRIKQQRKSVVVGVGGCWAQSLKQEVFERYPFVDVAFGPGQVDQLAQFLLSDSLSAQGYFEFDGFTADLPMRAEQPASAWLQISVGCNSKCSYCIVPSTRGREVGVSVIFPGFIRDAGMFHESEVELPRFVGTSSPTDVARAVRSAIESNRAEVDVAPLPVRAATKLSELAPSAMAKLIRRLGSDDFTAEVADRQSEKR